MKVLLYLSTAALLSSCAKSVKPLIKAGLIPMGERISIPYVIPSTHTINIVYTGCGGVLISKGKEAILTDPFYTGQWLGRLITGVKIKPKNTRKVFTSLNAVVNTKTDIKAVLVAHSHYDHLQDLPYLLEKNLLADQVKIIGSSSTHCTLNDFKKDEELIDADKHVHGQSGDSAGSWISVSEHMRVMPIKSGHAPHTKKKYVMKGSTCDKPFRWFKKATRRSNGFKWKDGTVYSFLIDILDESKNTEFRIFLQSSSCNAPWGFPPMTDGKEIDLALLGVASAQNVTNYPNAALTKLHAKKVLLIHWEDFFRDLYHKKPKSVRKTDMNKFISDLKTHYKVTDTKELTEFMLMPLPLTELRLKY